MGRQITEMLKGVLEGVVLAILADVPAYGYEITAKLRDMGFDSIAEGTVYALLVRLERKGFLVAVEHPAEKGPPRKVYPLSPAGRSALHDFWANGDLLAGRLEGLRQANVEDPDDATNIGERADGDSKE